VAKSQHTETIEVHPHEEQGHGSPGLFSPDVTMVLLTWVTFFLLLAILNKVAWKPILQLLDEREKSIRESLENADKIKVEMANLQETRDEVLAKAELKSKESIEQSRKAAVEAAKVIEHKAREEAKILLENAQREIKAETENAQAALREESSRIAIELAGKLIEENLDTEKNHELINRITKEL